MTATDHTQLDRTQGLHDAVAWAETLLDSDKPWKERRDAAEKLAKLARILRRDRELPRLIAELAKFPGFHEKVLNIATDLDLVEPLRRAAAWALSQINEWPDYFNENVLDSTQLENRVNIDASFVFLPDLTNASELPQNEQIEFAWKFLPHLDGKGFELRWDTKFHLGPFFRVIEDSGDASRRCIQYIYMWSRQNWPFSAFFSFYFWPFLSALTLLPLVTDSSLAGTVTVLSIASGLIALGAYRTLFPRSMMCVKNDTWYVLGGLLMIAGLIRPPLTAIIPLVAAFVLFVVRHFLGAIEHVMDYEPVYVYLRKDGADWSVERVRMDRFHYEAVELGPKELPRYLSDDKKTLFLVTDNVWRSFEFANPHSHKWARSFELYVTGWVFLYGFTLLLIALTVIGAILQAGGYALLVWSLIATAGLIVLNEEATTPISDPAKPAYINGRFFEQPERRILDLSKLAHVWNMAEDKSDFVIRKKMQNPFRIAGDKSYWMSFRDPSAERLAYEALTESRYLRRKLETTAKSSVLHS